MLLDKLTFIPLSILSSIPLDKLSSVPSYRSSLILWDKPSSVLLDRSISTPSYKLSLIPLGKLSSELLIRLSSILLNMPSFMLFHISGIISTKLQQLIYLLAPSTAQVKAR